MSTLACDVVHSNITRLREQLKTVDFRGCPANGFARDFYALGLDVYESLITKQDNKTAALSGTPLAVLLGVVPTPIILALYFIAKKEGWL